MLHRRSPARLPAGQREILRTALTDAVYYRDPPSECQACEALGDPCESCSATLAQATSYLNLSRDLGLKLRP